ncbi:TPA: hypothetical protein ACH3X1_005254 [Trebouxia sp. C0004]
MAAAQQLQEMVTSLGPWALPDERSAANLSASQHLCTGLGQLGLAFTVNVPLSWYQAAAVLQPRDGVSDGVGHTTLRTLQKPTLQADGACHVQASFACKAWRTACTGWVEVAKASGHRRLWATAVVGDALDQALDVSSGPLIYQTAVALTAPGHAA